MQTADIKERPDFGQFNVKFPISSRFSNVCARTLFPFDPYPAMS